MSLVQSAAEGRQMAHAALRSRYADLRRAHESIGREIEALSDEGRAWLARAESNVNRWESDRLCSPVFVRMWRRILKHPERIRTQVVAKHGGLSDSLMQNSPFGSAIKKALHH